MWDLPALVLFSGGQDSSTCLFWAKKNFQRVEALFFHYEQRHKVEYRCARKIAETAGVQLRELHVPAFKEIGGTAMIDDIAIKNTETGLPNTFVPGRNIVFLSLAASLAYKRGIGDLVTGVNDTDYSGYPDCRKGFISAMQVSLERGLDREMRLHAPLQSMDKAAIWKLSDDLGVMGTVIEHSHTCYLGDRGTRHAWGYGCGQCPACRLRKKGFENYMRKKK
jgi:7-cyano-7-deazaguanine synthase